MTGSVREMWQDQLDGARDALARHYPEGPLCACLRALPCPAAVRFTAFADEYVQRIGYYDRIVNGALSAPTLVLESRRVQHIASPVDRRGLCGAPLDPDMAGLVATCADCWRIFRERRRDGRRP